MTPSIGRESEGGHIVTDVNTRVHLLQSEPRLARALPGAMRYLPMNYVSELEMKGDRQREPRAIWLHSSERHGKRNIRDISCLFNHLGFS